jgi:hypothetical protein
MGAVKYCNTRPADLQKTVRDPGGFEVLRTPIVSARNILMRLRSDVCNRKLFLPCYKVYGSCFRWSRRISSEAD